MIKYPLSVSFAASSPPKWGEPDLASPSGEGVISKLACGFKATEREANK